MWTLIIWCLTVYYASVVYGNDKFQKNQNERNYLLQKELDLMLGSDIVLSDSEEQANKIFMDLKTNELQFAFNNPEYFNFSKHFFEYKDDVKKSELFKYIQRMPKGAILHAHDTAILGPDYVLSLTYLDDLYVCFEEENIQLLFSGDTPTTPCGTVWQVMKEARYSSGNIQKFDGILRKYFTLVVDDPNNVYTDINVVWSRFQKYFQITASLFTYKPVWEQYFYDTLKTLRADNVMYIELRSVLPILYDLDGNKYDTFDTVSSYEKALNKFLKDFPDFLGAKIIYAPLRLVGRKTASEYLDLAKKLQDRFPNLIAGFDLVGQEDLGLPLIDFMEILSKKDSNINYFFHAGETNWYGTTSDENIADAIVLGTRRIGHGYALAKHPLLMDEVKKRDIGVEVNVVSNEVLKLVDDMRNHPLAIFLANNMPVVISSDDPGIWEAEPLSHDFYVTFVAVASHRADLRLLKKLALNSLHYSTHTDKDKMIYEFEIRWTKFIDSVVQDQWYL